MKLYYLRVSTVLIYLITMYLPYSSVIYILVLLSILLICKCENVLANAGLYYSNSQETLHMLATSLSSWGTFNMTTLFPISNIISFLPLSTWKSPSNFIILHNAGSPASRSWSCCSSLELRLRLTSHVHDSRRTWGIDLVPDWQSQLRSW